MRNLEKVQISEIVDCMFRQEFKEGQFICREGAVGTELYVIAGQSVCLFIRLCNYVIWWKLVLSMFMSVNILLAPNNSIHTSSNDNSSKWCVMSFSTNIPTYP